MERPHPTEHIPYYEEYIALVPEGDVLAILAAQVGEVGAFVRAVPEERASYRYAPGKWSVRDVLGHLIDTERVFGYRAFSIARGETQPLNGYEQDDYATAAAADRARLADLFLEFEIVRRSNLAMFRRLSEEDSRRVGTAAGHPISVRALAYIMAGHIPHHLQILRERYGIEA
jgi:DinB family protein